MSEREADDVVEFESEMGAAPAAPAEMEEANDPEGYVGPDGKMAPHEQPAEVREHYDDGLDRLATVSLDDVEELGSGDRMQGPEADAATG